MGLNDKISKTPEERRIESIFEELNYTKNMEISNKTSYTQAKTEGAKYFIVDVDPNGCKQCTSKYEGIVFDINQIDSIPPIHKVCSCVPMFFMDKNDALNMAHDINDRNKEERMKYDEKYAKGYIAFSLGKEKFNTLNKEKTDPKLYLNIIPLLKRALDNRISTNTKAQVYRMVGDIYYKNGKKDLAIANFEKALSYNPKVGVNRLYNKLRTG